MSTRLSLWCERLIEAGWLVTLLLVPLFFQSTTERVFEPDKMLLIRSIALLMAVAWVIRALDRWLGAPRGKADGATMAARPAGSSVWTTAGGLIWPVVLLIGATLMATAGSIAPRMSWLGSYQRGQGFYSWLAFVVIFGSLLVGLRRRDQVERLVTVLMVGSIPAALFAVMQWLGVQPGVWRSLYGGRVFGTLGNPIFLGGYLLMLIPLTLARLTTRSQNLERGLYLVVLVLQGGALVLTLSRGPWLGLAGGLVFLALAWAAVNRRRGLALGIVGIVVALVVVVGGLNLPPVRDSLATAPSAIRRLSQLADVGAGSTGAVRLTLWDAAARVMSVEPLRLPMGYGPETGLITLTANASSILRYQDRPDVSPDRSHNENFDRLIETGLLGLIAYLWLVAAGVYLILRQLGLAGERAQLGVYAGLVGMGTLAGAGLPLVFGLPALVGLGLTIGLLAGLWAYLLMEALATSRIGAVDRDRSWLLMALLGALIGHFVEVSFGPANPVNRLLFWAFLGVVGAMAGLRTRSLGAAALEGDMAHEPNGHPRQPSGAGRAVPVSGPGRSPSRATARTASAAPAAVAERAPTTQRVPGRRVSVEAAPALLATSPWAYGALGGLLLATLVYSFVTLDDFSVSANGFAIVWFLALTVTLSAVLLWLEARHEAAPADAPSPSLAPVGGLVFGGLILMLLLGGVVLLSGGDALSMLWLFALVVVGGLGALAAWLPHAQTPQKPISSVGLVLYLPLTLAALGVIIVLNFVPITADMYLRAAEGYSEAGDPQTALNLTTRAFQTQLDEPVYAQKLAEMLIGLAQAAPSQEQRDTGFEQAVLASERAASLVPVDANYRYNVGNAYLVWAQTTQDQTLRSQRLAHAAQGFQQATQINPNMSDAYMGWGVASLLSNQSADATQTLLLKALELDPRNGVVYFYLGRLYQTQNQADAAEQAYLNGLRLSPTSPQAVTAYSALGDIYQKANRVNDAIQMTLKAIELTPDNWINHLNLALLYQRAGRGEDALNEAQLAYNLAPSDARQRVVDIIGQLRQGGR